MSAAAIACGCRRRGATRFRCGSIADRMGRCTPSARIRHAAERRRGRIERMRQAATKPVRRDIQHTAGGGLARPSESSRGTTGQNRVLDRSRACRGERGGRGSRGGIPCYCGLRPRSRDAIGAEQEAAGPCRKTRRGRRKRRHGNCIFWGFTQTCGSESSSSKDGGSPSKTKRLTPARPADAAPGAVDSFRFPPKKTQRRTWRRAGAWRFAPSRTYRIATHAVFDGAAGNRL